MPLLSVPDAAIELAKSFEGLRLKAYYDCVGFPTIGYGKLLSRVKGEDLSKYPDCTPDQAQQWLEEDLADKMCEVVSMLKADLNELQMSAILDFAYNLGTAAFYRSSLRGAINRKDWERVPVELNRWVYAGGRREKGLVRRRAAEGLIFSKGSN